MAPDRYFLGEQIPIRGEPGLIWLDNMRKYSRINNIIDNKDENAFGCNPCYTKDMLIYTDKGFIRIDECVGKTLKLFNGEEFTDALIRETGQNKEVYKVIFNDGSFVKCTENHKFILKDGSRKELKDLNSNDELYNPEILKCEDEGKELDEKYIIDNLDNLNLIYDYSLKTKLIYLTYLIQKYGEIDINNTNLIINKNDYNLKLLLETLGLKTNIKYNKIFINSYNISKLLNLYIINKINYSYIFFGIKSNEDNNDYDNDKLFMISKEKIGIEDKVYCATTLNNSHKFNCNGIIGGNCGEITLNSYELCNLSEVFINRINDYEEFKRVIKNAFIFTKIISLCKTHWDEINKNMEKNRRCGVSLTGIVNFIENMGINSLYEWTTKGYKELKEFDKILSKEFNVNESIKITCIKPSGSISLLVPNTPPGLHYPIYRYYIRRVRINEHATKLLKSLEDKGYYIENSETEPNTKIVNFVVDSRCKRSVDDVSMWEQLELAAKLQEWWADNQVSITVSFDPKTESKDIKHALDLYQYRLKGVSFLGKIDIDNTEFKQLPYEKITKEKYDELIEEINKRKKDVNIEIDENDKEEELFCTSNSCDLKQYKKMFKKNVIIISGLTGSGKSFIAQKVKDYFNTLKKKSIIISKDDYRYTENGYIDFKVNCVNEDNICRLTITVSDTGRGIKKEKLDTLFTKFNRLEEDRNSTIEGTGLGLVITKALIEMMGGKIVVDSTYGEGSKFTIFLSQKIGNASNIEIVNDKISTFDGKKVLVVDDNKLNIKVASKILKEFNLAIDSCESGFECIDKIENNNTYDLILMDIMMPKMGGVETFKKLKQIDNFDTPVVALTADAIEGKANKYLEVGFNAYLSKPIDKIELNKVLDNILNKKQEIEQVEENEPDESDLHKVIPITDDDIKELNKLLNKE